MPWSDESFSKLVTQEKEATNYLEEMTTYDVNLRQGEKFEIFEIMKDMNLKNNDMVEARFRFLYINRTYSYGECQK